MCFHTFAPRAYLSFGLVDLGFGVVEGILLVLLLQSISTPEVLGLRAAS